MTEHPILFSTPMVQAILDGRKTMTRRVVKVPVICPYGQVGDRLWVRETHVIDLYYNVFYKTDSVPPWSDTKWKPSIFMPRWASRITLEITNIRVERLQDISRDDAKKEGFLPSEYNGLESYKNKHYGNAELAFQVCWDDINGKKYPWSSNPWVFVIEFKRINL